jgi:DNA-binding CsgD family transcriptional regulator
VQGWPLVGRTEELRRVRDAVTAALPGSVVVAGAPGVGKTRLAVECLLLAERAGLATARVTATRAAAGLPFGAFAQMLPPDADEPGRDLGHRADLLRRLVDAIGRHAGDRRMVLLVDDAHLLDGASATLVHQLVESRAAAVVATVRAAAPAPDAIVALWKEQLAERVELGVLDPAAIEELLGAVLGGEVDAAALAALSRRCQGNVLFLRELVDGGLRDGTLRHEDGVWRLDGPLAPSDRLVELVVTRIGDVSEVERHVLEAVAFGEPLGAAEFAAVGPPAVADALERKGLLTSRASRRRLEIWLPHPIYAEVIRRRTHALRERNVARDLAEALEATGARRRGDTLRAASWRLIGGGGSAELLWAGALAARQRHDFALTEQFARSLVGTDDDFAARFLAAEAAHVQGRTEQAEAELAELATRASTDAQRARVAAMRFDNAFFPSGRPDVRILDDAEAAITDPAWRTELLTRRLSVMAQVAGPVAAAQAAAALFERPTLGIPSFGHVVAVHSLARTGRLDDGLRLAERFAGDDGPAALSAWSLPIVGSRALPLAYAGRLHEAELAVVALHARAVADGSVAAQAFLATFLAVVLLEQGRVRQARRRADEALRLFADLGQALHARPAAIVAATAHALAGDGEAATRLLGELESSRVHTVLAQEVDLLQARAWIAVAQGHLAEAHRHLELGAEAARDVGDVVGELGACHALARLGRSRDVAGRLGELAVQIDGPFAATRADHAAALVAGDATALQDVSRRFEQFGARLLAAEAAADTAVVHRRAGAARPASAAEQQALGLAASCEGAITPALQSVDVRARLTAAEQAAALLAAAGRSNREIADELVLSVRTVENRLQRVYDKLGVAGRRDLGRALGTG